MPASPGYEPEAPAQLTDIPQAQAQQAQAQAETPAAAEDDSAAAPPTSPDSGEVPWQVPNPTPPWPAGGEPPMPAPSAPPGPVSPPGPPAYPMAAPPPVPGPPAAPPAPAPGPAMPPPGAGYPTPGPTAPPPGPGYPAAPGYQSGPGYPQAGAPMQGPAYQVIDPHGVGYGAGRLGSGGRRTGKVPFVILAAVLEDEDIVEILASGKYHGLSCAAALVGTRVVIVNDREWKPEVVVLSVSPTMQVQGWQDDRSATLLFADGERQEVVERIADRQIAIEFAQRVRDRVAQVAAEQAAGQQ